MLLYLPVIFALALLVTRRLNRGARSLPFIFDDMSTLTRNPNVLKGLPWAEIRGSYFRALTSASYAVDMLLARAAKIQATPIMFYGTNYLLHAMNVTLLAALGDRLGLTNTQVAMVVSLGVLQIYFEDPVNYISGRAALLSTTLLLYAIHFTMSGFWPLAICFVALAVFAKEDAVMGVPLVLIIGYIWHGSVPWWVIGFLAGGLAKALKTHLPTLRATLRNNGNKEQEKIGKPPLPTFRTHVRLAFSAIIVQAAWFFGIGVAFDGQLRPGRLAMRERTMSSAVVVGVLLILAVLAPPNMKIVVAMVCLAPSLVYLVIPNGHILASHRYYFAMLSSCLLAGFFSWTPVMVLIVTVVLYWYRQASATWGSAVTIWKRVTEESPRFAEGWHELGFAYVQAGELADGRACFLVALELMPTFALPKSALAILRHNAGESDRAEEQLRTIIQEYPLWAGGWMNACRILLARKQDVEACEFAARATQLDSADANAYELYGHCLMKLGRAEDAAQAYATAHRLSPKI